MSDHRSWLAAAAAVMVLSGAKGDYDYRPRITYPDKPRQRPRITPAKIKAKAKRKASTVARKRQKRGAKS